MFPRILLGTDSSVIPLQFEHLDRSSFFGTVVKIPLDHSLGVYPSCHILLNNFFSHFVDVSMSAFISSPETLSTPGALLFLTFLNADLISSSDISSLLTSSHVLPFSILTGLAGGSCLIPLRNAPPIVSVCPSPSCVYFRLCLSPHCCHCCT